MVFAATSGSIAAMRKVYGKADKVSVAVELVVTMLMTVVTVGMVVQARKDYGPIIAEALDRAESSPLPSIRPSEDDDLQQ